jgi:prolyl oligopeptidase
VEEVTETYWGVEVVDPYRYMEDLEDPAVVDWMRSQADYTRMILDGITGRQDLIDKMVEFDSRVSDRIFSLQVVDTDRHFYLKQRPDEEVGRLYFRDGYEGEESLLFDPTQYRAEEELNFVITGFTPTRDGSKVAMTVAPNGSESAYTVIVNANTGELYPEEINRSWFAPSWNRDGTGFFYTRTNSMDVHDPDRTIGTTAYYHQVGTEPAGDRPIFSAALYPELGMAPQEIPVVVYDWEVGRMYAIRATVDPRLNVVQAPASELANDRIAWKPLFEPEDEVLNFAATPSHWYVYTSKDAPNYRLLAASFPDPDLENAEVLIPEDPDWKLQAFLPTADGIYFVRSRNDVEMKLFLIPLEGGQEREIGLPKPAGNLTVSGKGLQFSDLWINLSGWTAAGERHRYDLATNTFTRQQMSTIAEYPEYEDLVVEELLVPSHDGAEVPLSIIRKEGTPRNGSAPTLIYGYGAYGISETPGFGPELLLWTHEGGILTIAHVRGGGEKGHAWYEAGKKTTKPNTWKDLIACAEYLVENGYTSPGKIAINGGSAGGILIGRAMTERPDLFAATVPEVGVMNPLRAEETPNGPVNAPEFGTVQDSVETLALIEMDSYLKVQDGVEYPATLVTAGMNDPRVIAWQPAKFAARLIAANASDEPILLWVDFESGHGVGNTKTKQFETMADRIAFGLWQTGHPDFRYRN